MSEWIKCSERMPDDFEDVLVTDGDNVEVMWRHRSGLWDYWAPRNPNISSNDVTHWMPLPEPPSLV